MRLKGRISSWNEQRGFGFIQPATGGKPLFVHVSAFANRKKIPALNQPVSYTQAIDKQGRACADRVFIAGSLRAEKTHIGSQSLAFAVPLLFAVCMTVFALLNKIGFVVLVFYLVLSLFTFLLYALDKSAAQNNAWRTQERTLHLLALAGGWPGAMIAQQALRHKSSKKSFRVIFWLTVLLNSAVLIGLHTHQGGAALSSMLQRAL